MTSAPLTNDEAVLLYITCASREEAISLARELLHARLAACANIIQNATSIYWWQGEIEHEPETLLIVKTFARLAEQATEKVKTLHSYSCPCILTLPITGGNPEYLRWLGEQIGS